MNMKAKKIINRKCVVTRKIYPKDNLLRVVRLPNGSIVFDEKQNKLGRGAYIYKSQEAIIKAKNKDIFTKVFNTCVDNSLYDELLKAINKEVVNDGKTK